MRKNLALTLAVCLVMASVACGSSTTAPSAAANSGVTSLQITDVRAGTGLEATNGKIVTVHYTLWLYSTSAGDHRGTRIESSRDAGQPYSFTLGLRQVIQGWDQSVPGMNGGGQGIMV